MFQCGHRHHQGIHLVRNVCLVMRLLLVVAIVPTTAGIPIFWKNFIYDYSLTSVVFDNADDVTQFYVIKDAMWILYWVHNKTNSFQRRCFSLQCEFSDDGGGHTETYQNIYRM
jgi:hypothetical protein